MNGLTFFPLVLVAALSACQQSGRLHVENARVVLPPPGGSAAAAYLTIVNPEAAAYELVAVDSEAYESVEIHESMERDGLSRMRMLDSAAVPARGKLSLAPGAKHLMLFKPRAAVSGQVPMTLVFRGADGSTSKVSATFDVVEAGGEEHIH